MDEIKKSLKLKKFIFGTLLVFGLAFGAVAVISMAEQATVGGIKYNYDVTTKTASVASDNNVSGNITIPQTITVAEKNYTVTEIGSRAFQNCNNLTSVTIPNSVTTINYLAFWKCSNLTSVNISNEQGTPSQLNIIEYSAFQECSKLNGITIPNSVTSIGKQAFYKCSSLSSITIP